MILAAGNEVTLDISSLGAQGDGIGQLDGQTVRLELGLPGETWQASLLARRRDGWDAVPVRRLAGPDRAEPPCRHFTVCGGCRLQHAPPAVYAAFKRGRVVTALARRGLGEVEVGVPIVSPRGSRRRLRLGWLRSGRQVTLGLRQRRSHAIVDLLECPIAHPALVALLPGLRDLLSRFKAAAQEGEATLTCTTGGVDLLLDAARQPTLDEREHLAAFAQSSGLARLALRVEGAAEVLAAPSAPVIELSGAPVVLPPGAFLQATAEGEAALCAGIAERVRPRDRVLDLYAGIGTLSLAALAHGARSVLAVEFNQEALQALAATRRPGLSTLQRDLVRRPLLAAELSRFDVAILDPPRAGAESQIRELAASTVPRIVYASCDPESFARDARALVDAGYVLQQVQPIDQFLWSAEVELIAAFTRPERRRRA